MRTYLDSQYLPWLITKKTKTASRIIKTIETGFPEYLDKQLSAIHAWDIEKWRNAKAKTDMSASTINGYVNTLKGAKSRAVEWDCIESHDLHKVKSLKVDNAVVRYLSKGEEKQLFDMLRNRDEKAKLERENGNLHRQKPNSPLLAELRNFNYCDYLEPLIILAVNTGMRRGEIFSLEWSNVNLEKEFLTVTSCNSKSGKGRHIPLNQKAKQVLIRWLDDTNANGFVFKNADGQPLKDIKKAWGNLLKDAEINDSSFHDLRHHFASKLAMAGVDLNTVRELMWHNDLKMTLRYAHLAPEHKAAAVNLI